MDWLTALGTVVCFLTLVVTCKHVELQIRVNNILNLRLKANRDNEQLERKEEEIPPEGETSNQSRQRARIEKE
ncbi:hypothetical protein [Brevibacillus marinus]|uniref:hypothetical protein n=1 Tax=Brevibacillus marinus TaxID=2496837 RepID=UPI000F83C6C1|nr:hypothetical protein [Brevibacillus marinus]